jgi:hypothetical protein
MRPASTPLGRRHDNVKSAIQPYTLSKLQDPKDEGVGLCKASAKGTLKHVGDMHTACNVHWSDVTKKIGGK